VLDPVIDIINRTPKVIAAGALLYWLGPAVVQGAVSGTVARRRRRKRR